MWFVNDVVYNLDFDNNDFTYLIITEIKISVEVINGKYYLMVMLRRNLISFINDIIYLMLNWDKYKCWVHGRWIWKLENIIDVA